MRACSRCDETLRKLARALQVVVGTLETAHSIRKLTSRYRVGFRQTVQVAAATLRTARYPSEEHVERGSASLPAQRRMLLRGRRTAAATELEPHLAEFSAHLGDAPEVEERVENRVERAHDDETAHDKVQLPPVVRVRDDAADGERPRGEDEAEKYDEHGAHHFHLGFSE